MRPLPLAALAIFAATPALAAQPDERRVTDGNATYVYTVRDAGDRQVIDGRAYPAGSRFHLVVLDGRVAGTAGGVPVSFRARPAATGAR